MAWENRFRRGLLGLGVVNSDEHSSHEYTILKIGWPIRESYAQVNVSRFPTFAPISYVSPQRSRVIPRDAQRADKKEIAGRRRKERPLMGKECVIFPEGGLSLYDIQPLY